MPHERFGNLKDAGEIFHPLRWSPGEAARFLRSLPDLETAGVVVRMPATWRANRPARPQVTRRYYIGRCIFLRSSAYLGLSCRFLNSGSRLISGSPGVSLFVGTLQPSEPFLGLPAIRIHLSYLIGPLIAILRDKTG